MTRQELFLLLEGLHAYDSGATDSGIHDEISKRKVSKYLLLMERKDLLNLLSIFIRDVFLSDESLNRGYSIEDVLEFMKWLDSEMGVYI